VWLARIAASGVLCVDEAAVRRREIGNRLGRSVSREYFALVW
jgi:hypothetical protein